MLPYQTLSPKFATKEKEITIVPTKAYILIETAVGKTRDVSNALVDLGNILTVDAVTGPYDIIATASSKDLGSLGDFVTNEVHTIQGIVRTVTCLSVTEN